MGVHLGLVVMPGSRSQLFHVEAKLPLQRYFHVIEMGILSAIAGQDHLYLCMSVQGEHYFGLGCWCHCLDWCC